MNYIHLEGIKPSEGAIQEIVLTPIPSVIKGQKITYEIESDKDIDEEIVLSCEIVGESGVVIAPSVNGESVYLNLKAGEVSEKIYDVPEYRLSNEGEHTIIFYANNDRIGHLMVNVRLPRD